jgi:KDO2-lipid IV(A) lauroyltransferase
MVRLQGRPTTEVHLRGAKLGRLAGAMSYGRSQVAYRNLEMAFPSMSLEERRVLTRRVWEHFGTVTADFLAGRGRTLASLEDTTHVVGREVIEESLSRGKGALMISGQLGNWERIAAWVSLAGYPVSVIIRDANQADVNQLVNSLREAAGSRIIARGKATRTILERIRNNEVVAMLTDQNADDAFLPFFGKVAGVATGAGVIAERTGCAVFSGACIHLGDARYQLTFTDHIQPIGGNTFKGEAWMRGVHTWLESEIRQHPEQWLWIHDRWRSARQAGLL